MPTHSAGFAPARLRLLPALLLSIGLPAIGLPAHAATELPAVEVSGDRAQAEGSAESGYRQRDARLGPLGTVKLLDTPYSVNAVSGELLRNFGATTYSEAVKYLPSAYVEGHFGLEIGPPMIRGLQGDDVAGSVRIDGLNVRADVPLPIELYETLELVNGPTAALYGPAPAAGTINAVLKRPTDAPLREIGVEYSSRGNAMLRADLSGRAGEQQAFGYRVNLLDAAGEGYADRSELKRRLGAVALDYRLTPNTLAEFLSSYYAFDQRGYVGGFVYNNTTGLPSAPDPAKAGYGQPFGGVDASVALTELHLAHRFDNDWSLDGAVQQQIAKRSFNNAITNTLTNASGSYKTTYRQSRSESDVLSNAFRLNGTVHTGGLTHALAFGNTGYAIDNYTIPGLRSGSALTLGTASLAAPVVYADPGWGGTGTRYKASRTTVQSLTLADTIAYDTHWSTLLAANDSWINTHNWNASGATTSTYDKNGTWSYAASLLYKPVPIATTYLTYADSAQPGDVAPSSAGVNNPGEALAPYRSTSWELGAKASLADIDWTAALFRIERPFAYTDHDGYYKAAGEQTNKGLELTARGKAAAWLTLHASFTWLDPRMTATYDPAARGNLAVGVPRQQANLLAEVQVPHLSGAYVETDVHYIGKRAANLENSLYADAATTLDLGARYSFAVAGHRVTTRVMVANLTDRHYWASLYTGGGSGWSGTTGTTGTAFVGEPRTLKASATLSF